MVPSGIENRPRRVRHSPPALRLNPATAPTGWGGCLSLCCLVPWSLTRLTWESSA